MTLNAFASIAPYSYRALTKRGPAESSSGESPNIPEFDALLIRRSVISSYTIN